MANEMLVVHPLQIRRSLAFRHAILCHQHIDLSRRIFVRVHLRRRREGRPYWCTQWIYTNSAFLIPGSGTAPMLWLR